MMTRHYITMVLMLLISLLKVYPQSTHPFSARIAVASTNQSVTLDNGNTISSSMRLLVPDVGLLVDLFASSYFSIVTGLEYQQRGIGESVPFYNSWLLHEDALNFRFRYLSLPLLARFRYRLRTITPYALGGCSVNYNLDPLLGEPLVLDATFGVGIRVQDIFPSPVFIESRYSVDLTPALDPVSDDGYKKVNSNLIDIALGISF